MLEDDVPPKPDPTKILNTGLSTSVKTMDAETKKKLIAELRNYEAKDPKKAGRDAAMRVREDLDAQKIILESEAAQDYNLDISDGEDNDSTSEKENKNDNSGRAEESTEDDARAINRAIKRNPKTGRETLREAITRERESLKSAIDLGEIRVFEDLEKSEVAETNEHNIRIDGKLQFWKYTRGDIYGFKPSVEYPDLQDFSKTALSNEPSTPSGYLDRVRLQNATFNDDIRVEGLSKSGSLVISQRGIGTLGGGGGSGYGAGWQI